ncbi:hypothetical protein HU200_057856 [Digitaria exilis]|uniref:Uncharacterized protein n=1 Tax=Digitaria exilis TaxID=1010633 RepID=A0A835AJ42_9POAL|nr:hypothetical protein HU200_057856 [Digitaria exilis]
MEGISSPLAPHQSPRNQGASQGAARQAPIEHRRCGRTRTAWISGADDSEPARAESNPRNSRN